jgi:hypothetical protein
MPKKREPLSNAKAEKLPLFGGETEMDEGAEAMELAEFATRYRRKIQGLLWEKPERVTVGDLVKMAELESDLTKSSQSKRPRELRVVWINKSQSTT